MPDEHAQGRLAEVARLFTRLGFTAFGGPAAHVAMMEDEVVTRRKWVDRSHFLDMVAAINFIPGPNSTELAIHLGQVRAGLAGLFVAGFCFITPAVLIILPIAWIYVRFGALPQALPVLHAIGAAIVAVVVVATIRFAQTALKDAFAIVLAILVAAAAVAVARWTTVQPEIASLAVAAIAGAVWYARASALPLLALPPLVGGDWEFARLGWFFLKVGATLFGSGYVLVSYLQSGLVDHHQWLSQQQLIDAIAVGQFTPGPLLTAATFAGYVIGHEAFAGGIAGGLVGAAVATIAIFLPSFILVAIFGPLLQRIRQNRIARGALDGMNAAVVALMAVVAVRLAGTALLTSGGWRVDWMNLLIFMLALAGLFWKINATWLVLGAGLLGWMRQWVGFS
jgi:chromate transporter